MKRAGTSILVAMTALLGLRSSAQNALTNGLVGYYLFNETGSPSVTDSSGNNNNGLIIGTDWQYAPDRFGEAFSSLSLNLTNPSNADSGTYIAISRSPTLDFNQDFTISVWFNISSGLPPYHVHNLMGNGSDQTSANLRLISSADTNGNDYLQFVGNNQEGGPVLDVHSFILPQRNAWQQAVASRCGTNLCLYCNGILLTHCLITTTLKNLPQIWLGGMPLTTNEAQSIGEYPLDGGIDDVRFYDRALSSSDVQQLYASESEPMINLAKAVKPVFSNLFVGSNYQLQISLDLSSWTNQGAPFTATNSSMSYSQYFDVTDWGKFFFRLQVQP